MGGWVQTGFLKGGLAGGTLRLPIRGDNLGRHPVRLNLSMKMNSLGLRRHA